ncbi:hypothetical protein QEZ52_18385 [Aliisedimentitalea scapharcae]|uniref:Uncharacterized protein n=1 Tax=Aliisedimentitalea scapharcae TaxID=1524259 RepID=A0ABZ2XRP1_9RHOB
MARIASHIDSDDTDKPDCRECSDFHNKILLALGDYRVIACKDNIQWILQQRRRGNPRAGRAWRAIGYCMQRSSLARLWPEKNGAPHSAFAALPERFPAARKPRNRAEK